MAIIDGIPPPSSREDTRGQMDSFKSFMLRPDGSPCRELVHLMVYGRNGRWLSAPLAYFTS